MRRRLRAYAPRPERAFARFAAAALVYLGAWEALHFGFYTHGAISDTPLYRSYGEAMRSGLVPYRDFALEYPPGALPVFLAPTYLGGNYLDAFSWLMAALGLCSLGALVLCRPSGAALVFVALSPLLIGAHVSSRFDLWPTALMMAAIAAFLRDRHRLGWAALAAGFAAKLFPVLLMPLAAVWTLRRRGWSELGTALEIGAGVLAVTFVPFLVVAPRGLAHSLWGQLARPLQIESLAASFLMTFGHPHVIASHGSINLSGQGALAAVSSIVSALAIAWLWFAFARGPARPERLLRFAAACLCAFIVFGKVLSPQFLIWLVPLVPLIPGRRGLAAAGLLGFALLDTQVWFPADYFAYVDHEHLAWLVLVRNLALVALFLVLSLPLPAPAGSSSPGRLRRILRVRPRSSPHPRPPQADPGSP